jgi:von Willebrand factor type A domain
MGNGQMVVLEKGTKARVQRREVDVCFVFDTTGSMSDKIDGLVQAMDRLVGELGKLALDWRVTTVPFGDLTVPGDRIVDGAPFVRTVKEASLQLRSMPRFSGGGNMGESAVEAMIAGTHKPFRDGAVKVIVLITDEPALGSSQGHVSVDHALTALDAICFVVSPGLSYYRHWAENHGGEWREVTSAVDTTSLVELFRSLVAKVAAVADAVHRLGGGSVRAYLNRAGGA